MGNILEVTDSTFDKEVLQNELPVAVDFWAPWCDPCRMMAPILDQVSESLSAKIKFVKLNTDQNEKTASQYGITGIPCLIVFRKGKEINRQVGLIPKPALEEFLKKIK